jgi:hypothetical protein
VKNASPFASAPEVRLKGRPDEAKTSGLRRKPAGSPNVPPAAKVWRTSKDERPYSPRRS